MTQQTDNLVYSVVRSLQNHPCQLDEKITKQSEFPLLTPKGRDAPLWNFEDLPVHFGPGFVTAKPMTEEQYSDMIQQMVFARDYLAPLLEPLRISGANLPPGLRSTFTRERNGKTVETLAYFGNDHGTASQSTTQGRFQMTALHFSKNDKTKINLIYECYSRNINSYINRSVQLCPSESWLRNLPIHCACFRPFMLKWTRIVVTSPLTAHWSELWTTWTASRYNWCPAIEQTPVVRGRRFLSLDDLNVFLSTCKRELYFSLDTITPCQGGVTRALIQHGVLEDVNTLCSDVSDLCLLGLASDMLDIPHETPHYINELLDMTILRPDGDLVDNEGFRSRTKLSIFSARASYFGQVLGGLGASPRCTPIVPLMIYQGAFEWLASQLKMDHGVGEDLLLGPRVFPVVFDACRDALLHYCGASNQADSRLLEDWHDAMLLRARFLVMYYIVHGYTTHAESSLRPFFLAWMLHARAPVLQEWASEQLVDDEGMGAYRWDDKRSPRQMLRGLLCFTIVKNFRSKLFGMLRFRSSVFHSICNFVKQHGLGLKGVLHRQDLQHISWTSISTCHSNLLFVCGLDWKWKWYDESPGNRDRDLPDLMSLARD